MTLPLYYGKVSTRAASSQVFSALLSLTTVFGMGTGGPSTPSTPTIYKRHNRLFLFKMVTRTRFELVLPA